MTPDIPALIRELRELHEVYDSDVNSCKGASAGYEILEMLPQLLSALDAALARAEKAERIGVQTMCQSQYERLAADCDAAHARAERAEGAFPFIVAERDRYRAALEWYANPHRPLDKDRGDRARKALEGT